MVEEKNKLTAGADERTPSHPQYFSWVNSTNEGSTEAQTLINLDYFRYLYDTYGMRLEIYAWDAGNLDGSAGTYQLLGKSEKLKKQYPNGYGPIAEAAAKIGTRLGVWCGPDGFGDTEEAQRRAPSRWYRSAAISTLLSSRSTVYADSSPRSISPCSSR